MKKILLLLIILSLQIPTSINQVKSIDDPERHGIWLEDTQITYIGIESAYKSLVSGFDGEASDSTYLRVDYDSKKDKGFLLYDKFLPIQFTFRDDIGIPVRELWISFAYETDVRPIILVEGKNLLGFNNPEPDSPKGSVAKGSKYGMIGYQWERFDVPFNLTYAQPTVYELTVLVDISSKVSLRLDAIYLTDGSIKPQTTSPPLPPEGMYTDKIMFWSPPLAVDFKTSMQPNPTEYIKTFSFRACKNQIASKILAVTGGIDLGKVNLNIDLLPTFANDKLDVQVFTVEFMKKRFKRDGPIDNKVTVAEYIKPGNMLEVLQNKTGFFYVKVLVGKNAKSGSYVGKIRIRTETTEDFQIPFEVDVLPYDLAIPEGTIIFHENEHYADAILGKISIDEAWKRYELDFQDIKDHGVSWISFPLPTINDPPYMPDTPTLERLFDILKKLNMSKVFIRVDKAFDVCVKKYPDEYKSEMKRSLEKMLSIVKDKDLECVLIVGKGLADLDKQTIDLCSLIYDLGIKRCATFSKYIKLMDTSDYVEYAFIPQQSYDWRLKDSKYIDRFHRSLIYEPNPHWGHDHFMEFSLPSIIDENTINALSDYNSSYGNPFNDFDVKMSDGIYTPGDLVMTYNDEKYNQYSSLKWEAFLANQQHEAIINILKKAPLEATPNRRKSFEDYEKGFYAWNNDYQSVREFTNVIDPYIAQKHKDKLYDYLIWFSGGASVGNALEIKHNISFKIDSKEFDFDNKKLPMTVEPLIIDGSTFIPARYLVEPLGGQASWDAKTKTVTLLLLNHKVSLIVGSKTAMLDGKEVFLSSKPIIISGRTLIPLRAASQLLGAEVSWVQITKIAKCGFNLGRWYFGR